MICLETKKAPPAGCSAGEALQKAGRLIRLAMLRPDRAAKALVVTTAPRSKAEALRPDHRRSFCAYLLCRAEEASYLTWRDAEFLRLAAYFLEALPALPAALREELDVAVAGEA